MGTAIYLLTYVILFLFYFNMLGKSNVPPKVKPSFYGALMVYLVYCILEMLNFRGTDDPIVQVYGFVSTFAFVPLLFYLPKVIGNDSDFDLYLKWFVWLMIPLFILGIMQYYSPSDAFINKYAVDKETGTYEVVVGAGGHTRITGTFSYLATYASYLSFALHLLFYSVLLSVIRGNLSPVYLAVYAMGLINILMTQSRGSTLLYALTEGLTLLLITTSGQVRFLRKLIPLSILLGIGSVGILFTEAGSNSIDDFLLRLNSTGDTASRLEDGWDSFKFADICGPFGFGIGTAQHPMAPYLTNRLEMPGYWEEEGERIVIELGIIGFLLVMFLRWAILIACYMAYQKIKKLEYKILALQMTLFIAPYAVNMQTNIYNYVDGALYWMAIGLLYFVYHLDRQNNKTLEEQPSFSHSFSSTHY